MALGALISMQNRRTKRWRQGFLLLIMGSTSCHQGDPQQVTVVTLSSPSSRQRRDGSTASAAGYYSVKPGDTLSHIARLQGDTVEQLAKNNQLIAPYRLYPGQMIKLGCDGASPTSNRLISKIYDSKALESQERQDTPSAKTLSSAQAPVKHQSSTNATAPPPTIPNPTTRCHIPRWHWPTQGKIIEPFSQADGGNRGIDLAGDHGQAVYSSAEGRVVYAGNALHGYGHLLIIKHNEDWLSAYAHNDTLLVREQQTIKAGQKIATMGSSGTHSVRLHFEIRYKGKSVNPLHYLPQR
jgi:lipoprotein NlpD